MAGKKKKSGKGEGKSALLPKSIAGVKLPKDIRGKLTELAKHPVVADLLAAGLVALAARLKNEPKVRDGAEKVGEGASEAIHTVAEAAGQVATAIAKPLVGASNADAKESQPPATSTAPKRTRKTPPAQPTKPRAARRPAARTPRAKPKSPDTTE